MKPNTEWWRRGRPRVLTVPEGPDGLRLALAKEPAPPEEALVVESEDLLPGLGQHFSLQGTKA